MVIHTLATMIEQSGGRFLEPHKTDKNMWNIMDQRHTHEKIGHALRDVIARANRLAAEAEAEVKGKRQQGDAFSTTSRDPPGDKIKVPKVEPEHVGSSERDKRSLDTLEQLANKIRDDELAQDHSLASVLSGTNDEFSIVPYDLMASIIEGGADDSILDWLVGESDIVLQGSQISVLTS